MPSSYPFSPAPELVFSKKKPLSELAFSNDSVFDCDFPNRLPHINAFDLDSFAAGTMKRFTGTPVPSVDALHIGSNGLFYFIEFKNQKTGNIDREQLRRKLFGSYLIALATFFQNNSLQTLMKHSVFVIVFPKQDYSMTIGKALAQFAGKSLWKLDELVENEMVSKVLTLTDEEFSTLLD